MLTLFIKMLLMMLTKAMGTISRRDANENMIARPHTGQVRILRNANLLHTTAGFVNRRHFLWGTSMFRWGLARHDVIAECCLVIVFAAGAGTSIIDRGRWRGAGSTCWCPCIGNNNTRRSSSGVYARLIKPMAPMVTFFNPYMGAIINKCVQTKLTCTKFDIWYI